MDAAASCRLVIIFDLTSRYELNRTEMGRACMLSGSDIRGMEDALDTGLWDDESLDPET
jgi:hypothetical protein